ncbi:thiamine phosphate synthase [Sphingomonas crusticola]|uniref:thiamine phosphate synthase n=1 Tax=Sphingomonas crusticola TaxID=1697973 RepID=UPI001F072462|nr:thiamine phosphate synthase [Sphingomonas crusticola]
MRSRQPLPRLWLMTDERMGEGLWEALGRLPRGSGVIFRHYGAGERRALFERVRKIVRKRHLVLILAGTPREAAAWRADGAHGRSRHLRASRPLMRTAPAHDPREVAAARAHATLLSPVFATRSHPAAKGLGAVRFGLWARGARVPVIALGGMNGHAFRRLAQLGAYGWAGIDAFMMSNRLSPDQNLKVVPR